MTEYFIHLGLHKTGTTWLQSEVFSRLKNVSYLHQFELDTIIPDSKKVLISCEWLSGKPHLLESTEKMYIIADRLKKIFPSSKIIVGFRDKDSWLKSLWKQYIMEGGKTSSKLLVRNFLYLSKSKKSISNDSVKS